MKFSQSSHKPPNLYEFNSLRMYFFFKPFRVNAKDAALKHSPG